MTMNRVRASGLVMVGGWCLAVLGIMGCSGLFQTLPELPPLMPRDTDLPGWTRGPVQVSSGNTDLAVLDRRYWSGVRSVARARYSAPAPSGAAVTLDIIRCSSALDCLGIVDGEQRLDDPAPWCAARSWQGRGVMVAARGTLALRIMADPSAPAPDLGLFREYLCRLVTDRFFPGDLPAAFVRAVGTAADSDIRYLPDGHPAIPCLGPVIVRLPRHTGNAAVAFVALPDGSRDEHRLFSCLWRQAEPFVHLRVATVPAALRRGPRGSVSIVAFHKKWFFGLIDAETLEEGNKGILRFRDAVDSGSTILGPPASR